MTKFRISFSDAQRMVFLAGEKESIPTLSDLEVIRRKNREINIVVPIYELYNTYKVGFDIYMLNTENPKFMDNIMINMVTTLTNSSNGDKESDNSDSNDDTDEDIQNEMKQIVADFENFRPKKPFCYIVTVDLVDEYINMTKLKQLLDQVCIWMGLDSIPEGHHELFFRESEGTTQPDNGLREKMFLKFLKTNLLMKNRSFLVIMANLPSKYINSQVEEIVLNIKKTNDKKTNDSNKEKMDDIQITTPRDEKEELKKSETTGQISDKKKESEKKTDEETILDIVEDNTKKILGLAKKVFSDKFFFMNFDFEEEIQTNYAFQKISTKILNGSIGDFSNFKLHALPNRNNHLTTIKKYSKNTLYNSVSDINSTWESVKSFSLDLISSVYDT